MTTSTSEDFSQLADPFRRELLVHCYRMLGSLHDAEDLVQETLLRAWRSYSQFDGQRASLRTWLYRIATNACLTALDQRTRRPLPSDLATASDNPVVSLQRQPEVSWLQPIPTAWLASQPGDPVMAVISQTNVRLAFIAALQHLPAKQRAVLILRDVVRWSAAEVAEALDMTSVAVNSALQRARTQLARMSPTKEMVSEPVQAQQRELLDRYVTAFQNADVDTLTHLLRHDVELEMPPFVTWFAGREDVMNFLDSWLFNTHHGWHMVPTAANGQFAVATYLRDKWDTYRAHSIQVLTSTQAGIARIVAFQDPSLFPYFDLPQTRTIVSGTASSQ